MANALSLLTAAAQRKAEANKGKLIFAFDATASRGATWTLAQELQKKMFAAVKRLEVQLVVFRGNEFLVSPWENDASALEKLMSEISCISGQTQFSKTLEHIIEEHKTTPRGVNAFVLISDTFEEYNHEYHVKALAKSLGDLKIPGFFFLEVATWEEGTPQHEQIYKELASLSGGAYARFDDKSAEILNDLLTSVAAYAAGGLAALESRDSKAARLLLTQMKGK